jgi:hypothetical protein
MLERYPRAVRSASHVEPRVQPQTLAQCAEAYGLLGDAQGADALLRRLEALAVPGGHGWDLGYDLPGTIPLTRGTPAVTTGRIAYAAFACRADLPGGSWAADVCRGIAARVAATEPLPSATGVCFRYTPSDVLHVHNANLAAAEILSDAARRFEVEPWHSLAAGAVRYWLADWERGAGFEYLGPEDRSRSQIDHLHTAYVVRSVRSLAAHHPALDGALAEISSSYVNDFFEDGFPVAPRDRGWSDGHAFAEAARTLLELGEDELLDRVLGSLLGPLRLGNTFAYRIRRRDLRVDRMVYLRWVQAPVAAALAAVAASE